MAESQKGRIDWIDTARGLGLWLVFIGHLHTPYMSTWVYTLHMPLFFFLSSLVFSMHPFRTFLSKKFFRLVIPYFCLGAVIYSFYACVYLYEQRDVLDYWEMLLSFLSQKAYWTVWFLAALFIGEMILWLELFAAREKIKFSLPISVAIMCAAFLYYRQGGFTLFWCFDVACVAQFFMLLSYCLKKNLAQIERFFEGRNKILWALAFLLVNVAAGYLCIRVSGQSLDMSVGLYGNEMLTIISALGGIGFIIFMYQTISSRFLNYLGRNTMVFFAWHSRIVIVGCGMIYGALGLFQSNSVGSQFGYTLTTLALILAILYPATEGLKRTKLSKYFGL